VVQINIEKTKLFELLNNEPSQDCVDLIAFKKVDEFQYLGVQLSTKNDWSREIGVRIEKAGRASFALSKFLKSKILKNKYNQDYTQY